MHLLDIPHKCPASISIKEWYINNNEGIFIGFATFANCYKIINSPLNKAGLNL